MRSLQNSRLLDNHNGYNPWIIDGKEISEINFFDPAVTQVLHTVGRGWLDVDSIDYISRLAGLEPDVASRRKINLSRNEHFTLPINSQGMHYALFVSLPLIADSWETHVDMSGTPYKGLLHGRMALTLKGVEYSVRGSGGVSSDVLTITGNPYSEDIAEELPSFSTWEAYEAHPARKAIKDALLLLNRQERHDLLAMLDEIDRLEGRA